MEAEQPGVELGEQAGEIDASIDTDFEARAIWAYSSGIGQQGLLHPRLLTVRLQKKLITAYLDRLKSV